MGMSYSYYVGPYLQCDFHYKEKEIEVYGCPYCETTNYTQHAKAKYCDICGCKIGEYVKKRKFQSTSINDLRDLIHEKFIETGEVIHDGFEVLRFNVEDTPREFNITGEEIAQEIDGEKIIEEKKWMAETFKEEIEILKKHYDNVTFKWGCVTSWS